MRTDKEVSEWWGHYNTGTPQAEVGERFLSWFAKGSPWRPIAEARAGDYTLPILIAAFSVEEHATRVDICFVEREKNEHEGGWWLPGSWRFPPHGESKLVPQLFMEIPVPNYRGD